MLSGVSPPRPWSCDFQALPHWLALCLSAVALLVVGCGSDSSSGSSASCLSQCNAAQASGCTSITNCDGFCESSPKVASKAGCGSQWSAFDERASVRGRFEVRLRGDLVTSACAGIQRGLSVRRGIGGQTSAGLGGAAPTIREAWRSPPTATGGCVATPRPQTGHSDRRRPCECRSATPLLHRGRLIIEGCLSTGFIVRHADGSACGQVASPERIDNAARALSALRGLGIWCRSGAEPRLPDRGIPRRAGNRPGVRVPRRRARWGHADPSGDEAPRCPLLPARAAVLPSHRWRSPDVSHSTSQPPTHLRTIGAAWISP